MASPEVNLAAFASFQQRRVGHGKVLPINAQQQGGVLLGKVGHYQIKGRLVSGVEQARYTHQLTLGMSGARGVTELQEVGIRSRPAQPVAT